LKNEPLNIRVSPANSTTRGAKRGRNRVPLFIGLGLVGVMFVGIILFVKLGNSSPDKNIPPKVSSEEPKISSEEVVSAPLDQEVDTTDPVVEEQEGGELAVEDDGKLLWVSPTVGPPTSLRYVPFGTQLLLHLRPAELLAHSEGSKIQAALGPWGAQAIAMIEEVTGARLEEIATLLICVLPDENGELGFTLRCELLEAWDEQTLANRLPQSSASKQGEQSYLATNERACFLPLKDKGKLLISCSLASANELIESVGDAPPLSRDLERLLQRTDQQRHLTIVFPTKFLQASGNNLLHGSAQDLHLALQELVADEAGVIALSTHWGDDFFIELQSTVAFNQRPHKFTAAVRQRMSEAPNTFTQSVLDRSPHPYGQQVIERLPAMLRQVSLATRSGEEQGVSMMRCYLPLPAGHNLLMAAELTLNTRSTANLEVSADDTPPATVAEKLRKITSLSFTKETFERALEILSEDIEVPIKLRGGDLQLEGITKNQSFGIDLEDLPAEKILLEVLMRANPDRTASGPADPKQKLVYLVRETTEDQPGVIVVTTRTAVTKRGIPLPAVFEPESR